MLYASSNKPLYKQLSDILKQKILNGEYNAGEAIQGERHLEKLYGVSRITVRKAIEELTQEGFLYNVHGKGTFVATKQIERPLAQLLGVVEELEDGLNTSIQLISKVEEPASLEVSEGLQIEDGDQVCKIVRLIWENYIPLLIDYSYLPSVIGQLLNNVDLSKDLIYRQLELCGYSISHGEQWISAGLPYNDEAFYLQCSIDTPILKTKRITYVENNKPIIYSVAVYRSDRYQYKVNLQRHLKKIM